MTIPAAKNDIVPSFDPEKSDLTSANWLHKIKQLAVISLAVIHGWKTLLNRIICSLN